MKNFSFSTLLLVLLSTAYSQNDKTDYKDAFRLIEVWLDAQKDYENLPGLSAEIVEDQDILWFGAVGLAYKFLNPRD